VTTISLRSEAFARGARMPRTALGPAISRYLEDPSIVEVMLNPDGRLWIDRLSGGLEDTGCRVTPADAECIVPSLMADGAYDVEAVYDAVAERHPGAAVIIPPRATAIANEAATCQGDGHIAMTAQHGRIGWQRRSGYNRRSLVETAVLSLQGHHWPTTLRSESAQ
jgi:hypothetical protein